MGGHNSSGTSTKSKRGETKTRQGIGTSRANLAQEELQNRNAINEPGLKKAPKLPHGGAPGDSFGVDSPRTSAIKDAMGVSNPSSQEASEGKTGANWGILDGDVVRGNVDSSGRAGVEEENIQGIMGFGKPGGAAPQNTNQDTTAKEPGVDATEVGGAMDMPANEEVAMGAAAAEENEPAGKPEPVMSNEEDPGDKLPAFVGDDAGVGDNAGDDDVHKIAADNLAAAGLELAKPEPIKKTELGIAAKKMEDSLAEAKAVMAKAGRPDFTKLSISSAVVADYQKNLDENLNDIDKELGRQPRSHERFADEDQPVTEMLYHFFNDNYTDEDLNKELASHPEPKVDPLLTRAERVAIAGYTENFDGISKYARKVLKALQTYLSLKKQGVKASLQHELTAKLGQRDLHTEMRMVALMRGLKKMPSVGYQAFSRGADHRVENEESLKLSVASQDDLIVDAGPMSASAIDYRDAAAHRGVGFEMNDVQMIIGTSHAKDVKHLSRFRREDERLVMPGTLFQTSLIMPGDLTNSTWGGSRTLIAMTDRLSTKKLRIKAREHGKELGDEAQDDQGE